MNFSVSRFISAGSAERREEKGGENITERRRKLGRREAQEEREGRGEGTRRRRKTSEEVKNTEQPEC